jgi:hypothetical protein
MALASLGWEGASFCANQLTAQFTRAIDYARQVHVSYHKGTPVPKWVI